MEKSKTSGLKVTLSNAMQMPSANRRSLLTTGRSLSRLKMRKYSYGFGQVSSIKQAVERSSQLSPEFRRPPLLYLNTYQLEPSVRFKPANVTFAVDEILDLYFLDHKYNIQESPSVALRIAGELVRKVKSMELNRYRIIAVVTLGQKRAQSYNNAVSFLWDHERDNYVDIHRETPTAFIQVTVFGIYLD